MRSGSFGVEFSGGYGCLLGRAFVYGLAAYGQAGVDAALQLIAQELDEAMILTGAADVNALPDDLAVASETGAEPMFARDAPATR